MWDKQQLLYLKPFFLIIGMLFLTVNESLSQSVSPLLGTEFERFNFQEFNLRLSETNLKDKMLCDDWCGERVITKVDTLDVQFNYDLAESTFYLNMNDKVFALRSDFIISFDIKEQTYLNYFSSKETQPMILEILVDGQYVLYKHHNLVYKKPDFDPILNIGNKEGSYKMSYQYYTHCKEQLIEISSKTKKAIKKLHKECGTPKGLKVKGDVVDLFLMLNDGT